MSATIINLIIQLIAGVVGGNAVGAASQDLNLGTLGNTIAGAIGGVGGGELLTALIPMGWGGRQCRHRRSRRPGSRRWRRRRDRCGHRWRYQEQDGLTIKRLDRRCGQEQIVSRRDPSQKRRRNRFWHVSLARQVFAKLGPSQPESSSAADQRLCVRLADTEQRIAGSLLRPTSFRNSAKPIWFHVKSEALLALSATADLSALYARKRKSPD